jgi:hypothetical protein
MLHKVVAFTNAVRVAVAALVCCGTSVLAQSQSGDQVAIQLGAIQLRISDVKSATAQNQANALVQGRLAMATTDFTYSTTKFVSGSTPQAPQSSTFRDQLYQAVQAALASPLDVQISGNVPLSGGSSVAVSAGLSPVKTTASAVLETALRRIPNSGPGLVGSAVDASVNERFGKPGKGEDNARKAATMAMSYSLRTYAAGTVQWPATSTTPPSLPNFSLTTVNGVPPSQNGLMDAAAAIAANAINGLGDLKGNDSSVAAMTTALVRGADQFQKTSQQIGSAGASFRFGGTISAASTGLIAQFAGDANNNWSSLSVLDAIVQGAVQAVSKRNLIAVAYGVAAGFSGTYFATNDNSPTGFDINDATSDIIAALQSAGCVNSKNQVNFNKAVFDGLNMGLSGNWSDPVNGLAGIDGIKDFTVVNGVGAPLTDTVGL